MITNFRSLDGTAAGTVTALAVGANDSLYVGMPTGLDISLVGGRVFGGMPSPPDEGFTWTNGGQSFGTGNGAELSMDGMVQRVG
ncbi:MAG TPA: hypothetical protein VGS79_18350 [Puia sp.]|nr:hypothetical protein [Puia sp.]